MREVTLAVQGIIDPILASYPDRISALSSEYSGTLDGLEVGFFLHRADSHASALELERVRRALSGFSCNTVHIAARAGFPMELHDLARVMGIVNGLFREGALRWVSFHLDMLPLFDEVEDLADSRLPLLWENLDRDAASGNTLEEAEAALESRPRWDVTLDVAHVLEMEAVGGQPIGRWVDVLGNRVRQLHISWPDNLYRQPVVGPDFSTRHSMTHLHPEAAALFEQTMLRLPHAVATLEGVVPAGEVGGTMLLREIQTIRNMAGETAEPGLDEEAI